MLVENTAGARGTLGEHGLSILIETASHRVLFDTGQGMALANNARCMDVPLDQIDAIVLSHGHYDHTGGLRDAIHVVPHASVYAHPSVFGPKYARRKNGTVSEIGMADLSEDTVRGQVRELVLTSRPMEICDGMYVTGEIPRTTEFEDTGGSFFIDDECRWPDMLLDDQALYFECARGVVVVVGCAHAGIINTLQYINKLTGDKRIHAVIGGMHLVAASDDRVDRTIETLRQLGIDRLVAGHCTGLSAVVELWKAFPNKCSSCKVGTSIEFDM